MSEPRAGEAWAGQESRDEKALLGGTEVGRIRSRAFGEVAQEYDRFRPGYPETLIDDVVAFAGLDDAAALEVGAGTGKATVAFASRGVAVTAVEPDPAMAAVLGERVSGWPQTSVVVSSFEDLSVARPYGLLFSAQAWHWTDPVTRWERAAAALRPGGALALFWNFDHQADPAVFEALVAVHQRYGLDVGLSDDRLDDATAVNAWPGSEIVGRPDFTDLSARVYRWKWLVTGVDYVAYLGTHSPYRLLPAATRERLFQEAREIAGEWMDLDVETVLFLARRRS